MRRCGVGDKTALVVIDTQRGMFEATGVPPVPDGEHFFVAAQVIAHHNEVMGNGFAEVVPSGKTSSGEGVRA